jgi:DNA-binding transcriptional ArsR family regulator
MRLLAIPDTVFKAVAHPTRREILALLSASPLSVHQLAASFSISQPAVSQHLRELRDASLVTAARHGIEHHYSLTAAPLQLIHDWSSQYRRFFDPAGHAWAFTPSVPSSRKSS